MAKKSADYEMQEFFIKPQMEESAQEASPIEQETVVPVSEEASIEEVVDYGPAAFEESLQRYSSANVPRGKKRKKRKLGTNGLIRLLALCLCIGVFAFSLVNILSRSNDLAEAARVDELTSIEHKKSTGVQVMGSTRCPPQMQDLLSFLGSGGLQMFESLDTDTQIYYETLREMVFDTKKVNPDCWGYIVMSNSQIADVIMKGDTDYEYLYRLWNREANRAGSIFAAAALKDDYEANRNVVVYGHCMTDGTKFRGIKLFFDSDNRYSLAQDLEITVVTEDAVYVYEYFSGYRAEGDRFATCYSTATNSKKFYNFLMERRSLNTISKDVTYDENSKIITLITCTNLSSKPGERYVLHGILKNTYYF